MLTNKNKNIYSSQGFVKPLLENKFKPASPTNTPTKKEIKNITIGTVSTSVPRMKRKKKQPKLDVILNLILGTQQLIFSMKEMEPIFVFSMQGGAVPME